jgi:hypothetical protein
VWGHAILNAISWIGGFHFGKDQRWDIFCNAVNFNHRSISNGFENVVVILHVVYLAFFLNQENRAKLI